MYVLLFCVFPLVLHYASTLKLLRLVHEARQLILLLLHSFFMARAVHTHQASTEKNSHGYMAKIVHGALATTDLDTPSKIAGCATQLWWSRAAAIGAPKNKVRVLQC